MIYNALLYTKVQWELAIVRMVPINLKKVKIPKDGVTMGKETERCVGLFSILFVCSIR